MAPDRVERGGRLVQQDQFGTAEQGDAQPEPLLHALGEALHFVIGPIREADGLERALDLRSPSGSRQPGQLAMQAQDFPRLHPALVAEQLGEVAETAPGLEVAQGCPEHPALAGRGPGQANQQFDGGRLAGAVGPQEAEHLGTPDTHRQAGERDRLPIALRQVLCMNSQRGGVGRLCRVQVAIT